jgi:hypothetical protein
MLQDFCFYGAQRIANRKFRSRLAPIFALAAVGNPWNFLLNIHI